MSSVAGQVDPSSDESPGVGRRMKHGQCRQRPPQSGPIGVRGTREKLNADRSGKRHLVGVEQGPKHGQLADHPANRRYVALRIRPIASETDSQFSVSASSRRRPAAVSR